MHWRMWNGGTSRCLLWGDPDYVRTFAESVGVYGGDSFEVNEMLATKMLGEDHDAEPFQLLAPPYRFYDYEFERYWYFYRVWGRVSYNPDLPESVLLCEWVRRFGPQSGPHLMRGMHFAGKILPRIVAATYNYRFFPTTRGWAEMMRMGDLPQFAKGEGSDISQFTSFAEEARPRVSGEDARRGSGETARWFAETATTIRREIAAAEQAAADPRGEFRSTVTDLNILAGLADYYAYRIPAAVSYNTFLQTKAPQALTEAIRYEGAAIAAWRGIVEAAGDVYSFDMAFGVERVGFPRHWRDELPKLEAGLKKLNEQARSATAGRAGEKPASLPAPAPATDTAPPTASLEPVGAARPGKPLPVTATVDDPSGVKWVRLRYRHLTQFEDYQTLEMIRDPQTGSWLATIPGEFIVPEWDLIYFVETMDRNGNGRIHPDLDQGMPYVTVELERGIPGK